MLDLENVTPSPEILRQIAAESPMAVFLGVALLDCGEGWVEIELPLRDEHRQLHGFAHGAIVGFMADYACAWAAVSVAGNVVTQEYKVNLLSPAMGPTLMARGEVLKATRRTVVCRADVFSVGEGPRKLVATCLATIMPV